MLSSIDPYFHMSARAISYPGILMSTGLHDTRVSAVDAGKIRCPLASGYDWSATGSAEGGSQPVDIRSTADTA